MPRTRDCFQIINSCMNALSCAENDIDVGDITDFAYVKDKVCYKLVNTSMNRELLSTVPHRDYLDLAIVYYIPLSLTDNGLATLNITDGLAHIWDTDEETLYKLACSNTPVLNRGCVTPMLDIMGSIMNDMLDGIMKIHKTHKHETSSYEGFDFTYTDSGSFPMCIATNQNKTYGASILLYDGFLETAAEKFGSFYILPSSIHELIIVPEKFGDARHIPVLILRIKCIEHESEKC